eukprot:TRINITY_DN359_c1_g3_i2.p1 TRINITY_DN359_c1_g3~~TRINITY_DN359_c1_g3_i2.p1  ORF type:complete len:289 (+),score=80.07 TRINITY_DN359_c1_g3_i2:114-869(+)
MQAIQPAFNNVVLRADLATKEVDPSAPLAAGMHERAGWNPYQDNGGTTLAISGKDFVVVAADTRMSNGYSIMNRETSKCSQFKGDLVLVSGGMMADRNYLHKNIKHRLSIYEYKNKKVAGIEAVAQMLSGMLYNRRMFPLYTYNILCGIDADGNGAIYSYDVVGCIHRDKTHAVTGSARDLVEPILDCYLNRGNMTGKGPFTDISKDEAIDLAKDALSSGAERDLETGDAAEIFVITKDGVERLVHPLRRD